MKNTHQSKDPDQENACSQITAATTSPHYNRHGLCVEVTVWAKNRQQETCTFTLGGFNEVCKFEKIIYIRTIWTNQIVR